MIRKLLLRYEWLVFMGLLIAILSLSNVLGYTSLDSDIFWAVAGLGLAVEGCLELYFGSKEEDPVEEIVHKLEDSLFEEAEKRYGDWRTINTTGAGNMGMAVEWGDDH
tara:strand:+ start:85 stop:408 length:324 start_codon:yes stop_codon:yes gene_type:complete